MRKFLAALVAVAFAQPALAERYRDTSVPMATVAALDLERYLGKWYEIARFPNRFEKGCEGVTAEYSLRDDGKVRVLNTCREGSPTGEARVADGQARVVGPGKLTVTFVPWLPFARGDYWVLYLDPGYTVAAVGEPKGKTGWILARNKTIPPAKRKAALAALARNGYDTSKLYWVQQ